MVDVIFVHFDSLIVIVTLLCSTFCILTVLLAVCTYWNRENCN